MYLKQPLDGVSVEKIAHLTASWFLAAILIFSPNINFFQKT
jgi:hypothetical protein